MIKKTLMMAIVVIGLIMSGCTEDSTHTLNNTTDTPVDETNLTANASEHAGSQSVSIPLERPPFIEDQ